MIKYSLIAFLDNLELFLASQAEMRIKFTDPDSIQEIAVHAKMAYRHVQLPQSWLFRQFSHVHKLRTKVTFFSMKQFDV